MVSYYWTYRTFIQVIFISFLRCESDELADVLLKVHNEKHFVELLIEGIEERTNLGFVENQLQTADEMLFPRVLTRWHYYFC